MEPGVERFFDEILGPQEQDPSEQCGDLLVRDRMGNWTYQYAVTVDDHVQRITDVIRGAGSAVVDGRQIRLARLLGRGHAAALPASRADHEIPAQKLSKSDHDTGVRDLRASGWTREQVLEKAANLQDEATSFAVLALSLLVPAVPMAHPGHDHKLMGTISSIDKNKIVMKTTEGKDMTFEVVRPRLQAGTKRGAQADLKAGMRVVVNVGDGVEPLKAKEVQYSAPTTTAKQ
jgi:hypothetical protein